MGATGWSHFVPYQSDINAALQQLRQQVFASGNYIQGDAVSPEQTRQAAQNMLPEMDDWMKRCTEQAASLPEPLKSQYLQMADRFKKDVSTHAAGAAPSPKQKPRSKSIEELIEQQAETGTHSILDIESIATRPRFAAITKFPEQELIDTFGSATPTHAQIEEAHENDALEDHISNRWQGIYIIAYENNQPKEIFFAGCSGD